MTKTGQWRLRRIERCSPGGLCDEALEGWLAGRVALLEDGEAWAGESRLGEGVVQAVLVREGELVFVMTRPAVGEVAGIESLARVYSILSRSLDATVFTDVTGALLGASRPWRAIYGFELGELLGANPRVINSRMHPASHFEAMWRALTDRATGTWSGELINRRKNGEPVRVWQTITAVRGPSGRIEGYLGITRDMSAHHELRERLARSVEELERLNRFKSELMALAAHDLKSPLGSVMAYTDLIRTHYATLSTEKVLAFLDQVSGVCRHMLTLIRSVLDLQRAEAGRLELERQRVNFPALVRGAVEMQRQPSAGRRISLRMREPDRATPVFLDALKFDQALGNVLSNAVKFSPDGGEVNVSCEQGSDGICRVVVEDDGPGIPADEREAVFDPYYQVSSHATRRIKAAGSGWGLAIARRLIDLHGGSIRVETRAAGSGCRMVFELPSGYEAYGERVWAAVCFDPSGRLSGPLCDRFAGSDVPHFLAPGVAVFRDLCARELPNLLIVDADRAGEVLPWESRGPAGEPLRPAVLAARLAADGTLCVEPLAGDGALVEAARSLLASKEPCAAVEAAAR